MSSILSILGQFVIHTISSLGYGGIALLMGVGAFNIPLPSEVILPFSGFLVFSGRFNILLVAVFATIGWLVGAIFSYYLGKKGGRPLIEKYGKYVLLSHKDLNKTEKFFNYFGSPAIFIGQLLPVVRNFISLAAGIAKQRLSTFLIFTALGSFIWALVLTYVGYKMGENWESLKTYFSKFDYLIVIAIVLGIIWYVWRHIKNSKIKS